MLPGARHRPYHLAGRAGALQGLHLDAQAERLPLDPHHRDRARQAARRAADPHPRDAADRRIRHRRARALQGRRRLADRDAVARVERLCLAAPHHRAAGRRLQPGRIPRAHQARTVPRPGVLLHAEGQADRAAARRHADRFRLCGAHRRRQHGDRRQDQRQDRAAVFAAAKRRRGADPDLQGADRAAGRLGIDRGHRQGARRHPPRHARGGAQPIFGARPAHRRAAVPARQDRIFRREARRRAAAAGARPRSTT